MKKISVLIVDDHLIVCQGLKQLLQTAGDMEVVGEAQTGEAAVREARDLRPNVVLLDIEMPGPDVFEMADRLRHMHKDVRFVFLSAHVRDGYLAAAYKCGAWGYFAKGDELEAIVEGVKEVARSADGVFVMGPKVKQRCQVAAPSTTAGRSRPSRPADSRPRTALEALTPREIEVLRLIGRGQSRLEIARELSRSAKTVDGHQERIMKKLDRKGSAVRL